MTPTKSHATTRNPLAMLVRSLTRDLFGVYRPERYYMRGPGPKWREKHAPQSQPSVVDMRTTKAAF